MYYSRQVLFLLILFIPLKILAQEYFNPVMPQPFSKEFKEYINMIEKNNISTIRFKPQNSKSISLNEMNQDSIKKLVALAIFSRLNNPLELIDKQQKLVNQIHERGDKFEIHYLAASDLFLNKNQYLNFNYKYKHILYDLYYAPYVFVGIITNIDTIYEDPPRTLSIIEYEMIISDNINSHYNKNVVNKKLKFLYSVGHWATFDPYHGPHSWITPLKINCSSVKDQNFLIGNKYLIFIYNMFLKFPGTNKYEEPLPVIRLTAYKNLNFPVENSYIIDTHRYFGNGEKITLYEAKDIINSIFSEIENWKE